MTLLRDIFYEQAQTRLEATGWVFTLVQRYDPTRIEGLTPTGRAFTATFVDSTITVAVAGRVRTITRIRALWEPGDATVQALLDAWNLLPVSQR